MTSVTLSPAELVAASLCWLAGMKVSKVTGNPRIGDQVEGYWHDRPCRFCTIDPKTGAPRLSREELMAQINATWAAAKVTDSPTARSIDAFGKLERKVKTARVKEAQEEPWYDAVTRA